MTTRRTAIWADEIGLPPERIVRWGNIAVGDEKNFWRMGDTGPCGPCSELHYDRGVASLGGPRLHSGPLGALPALARGRQPRLHAVRPGGRRHPHAAAVQERRHRHRASSAWHRSSRASTRTTGPTSSRRSSSGWREFIGHDPETVESERFSYQVVADHSRAMTFLLAEGVTPSNEGPGYVLRRIMRRAVRHGRLLGIAAAVPARDLRRGDRPHGRRLPAAGRATRRRSWTASRPRRRSSRAPWSQAAPRLDELFAAGGTISGADAFRLHDTFGFPIDLTIEMAAERGVAVDRAGFDAAMAEQRERSRGEKRERAPAGPGGRGAAQRVHRLPERDERRRPARARRRSRRTGGSRPRSHAVLRRGRRADRGPRRAHRHGRPAAR